MNLFPNRRVEMGKNKDYQIEAFGLNRHFCKVANDVVDIHLIHMSQAQGFLYTLLRKIDGSDIEANCGSKNRISPSAGNNALP